MTIGTLFHFQVRALPIHRATFRAIPRQAEMAREITLRQLAPIPRQSAPWIYGASDIIWDSSLYTLYQPRNKKVAEHTHKSYFNRRTLVNGRDSEELEEQKY